MSNDALSWLSDVVVADPEAIEVAARDEALAADPEAVHVLRRNRVAFGGPEAPEEADAVFRALVSLVQKLICAS